MQRWSEDLTRWRDRGRFVSILGREVFVVDEGEGPCVCVLHGFPTSGFDWREAVATLRKTHRVIVADMPGYGLSSKSILSDYSLVKQADVLVALWQQLGVSKAHMAAHDMGTSVLCELLARREEGALPITVQSVLLSNGSVYIEMAKLTPSQHLLRARRIGPLYAKLAMYVLFRLQFRRILARNDRVSDRELRDLWALLTHNEGLARLPTLVGYIDERYARVNRWLPPLRRLDIPALVLWGDRDPVAVVAMADRLAREIPDAALVKLDGVGHYPMLEDSERFCSAMLTFWSRVERRE
ncbi:MAG: alpha/beta hydrolase [Deltaproteobacteria bacterium]|nr:alpha/beta hydrolase [Deltaproteobacteria bacterium]